MVNPYGRPVQPFDRLKWEHVRLIDGVGKLQRLAGGNEASHQAMYAEAADVLKALEYHQEAEERFLFPLVSEHEETLLAGLRQEHLRFVMGSDGLLALARPGSEASLAAYLVAFKMDLEAHFTREESGVFQDAIESLSPAQMDILRIKFASRKGMGI